MCLTIRIIDLGSNLDIVKVLIKSAFGEKTLSPVAGWGTGSTGLSRRTWHFHLPGKVPGFSAKTVHFPPWSVALPVQRGHCFH